MVTTSRRAAPDPRRHGLVGPGLARPRGGAGGAADQLFRALHNNKGSEAAGGGGQRRSNRRAGPAPRPPSREPQLPQQPRAARRARRLLFRAVQAAGRAHVSAGGAGPRPLVPAGAGALPQPARPALGPPSVRSAAPRILPALPPGRAPPQRAQRARGRTWAGPSSGAGRRLSV